MLGVPHHSHIVCIRLYPLSIPMRKPFRHAAHERAVADPLVVEIELADGTRGYGETLPRPYVTGETVDSVIESVKDPMLDELLTFRPATFAEALERIDALPSHDELGRVITAARAGVELALLDAYGRRFGKSMAEVVGWLGLPGLGPPGSGRQVRYSAVISGEQIRPMKLRMMRWFGLRDFKLKVGDEDDVSRIRTVARALKVGGRGRTNQNAERGSWHAEQNSALNTQHRVTLRLDANGGWLLKEAVDRLRAVSDVPLACIEQPMPRDRDADLPILKRSVQVPIMHDESLVTFEDAERLAALGVADAFNIRISKNGGFLPSVRLAHFARKNGIAFQLGCMVGETSILSAAGRRFIENVPGLVFAEGSYGRFLLRGDVVARPIQFGYGGKIKPLSGPGWGIDVRRELLEQYTPDGVLEMPI